MTVLNVEELTEGTGGQGVGEGAGAPMNTNRKCKNVFVYFPFLFNVGRSNVGKRIRK